MITISQQLTDLLSSMKAIVPASKKVLLTHPDNVAALRKAAGRDLDLLDAAMKTFPIKASTHLARDRPSGRYILPDGRAVRRENIRIPDGRFFEWGGSTMSDTELHYLLSQGIIKEERQPLFYLLDEGALPNNLFAPVLDPVYTMPLLREPPVVLNVMY